MRPRRGRAASVWGFDAPGARRRYLCAVELAVSHALAHVATRRSRPPVFEGHALPPGPSLPPPLQLAAFLYRPIPFLRACRRRLGPVVTLSLPATPPIVQFSRAEHIKAIFQGSPAMFHAGKANQVLEPFLGKHSVLLLDDRPHLEQRRLLLPPFRGDRMRAYGAAMRDITRERVAAWPAGKVRRAQKEMQEITLSVILRTVFGFGELASDDARAMRRGLVSVMGMADNPMYLVTAFQRDLGPRSPWGRFVRERTEVRRRLLDRIARARRSDERGEDILSLLLDATHEDGAPMSDEEILDELLTMLIAGHETTATSLAWALHRLVEHPDVLARVQAEVDAVDPDDPHPVLDAFCKEVLRIHPVIPGVGRILQEPATIVDVDLPAGVMVGGSILLAHFDEENYPEPDRFDLERFLDKRTNPYTFFPFGGSVRRCIGEAFARYEMRMVLDEILRHRVPRGTGARIRTVRRNLTLSPSRGAPIRLDRRLDRR